MDSSVHPPPRLLIGATLLFWGAMTGHSLLGLGIALLVEGANWFRFRWDFDAIACSRAWRISMILILIAGVLIWLDGDRYTALPKLMVWLPLLLLPLQFIQSYGLSDRMPLNSFSFFSNLRRMRNRRLGLSESIVYFNFGNPYLVVILVSASLGINAQQISFLPGLVILSGWLVFSRAKTRPLALVAIVILAGALGLGGQLGMSNLYHWVTNRNATDTYPGTDSTVSRTSIGSLGKIKQSPEMLWRIKTIDGTNPPRLLRLASYNRYKATSWRNEIPESLAENLDDDGSDFRNLGTRELEPGDPFYLLREKMTAKDLIKPLPSFRLRGASRSEAPLPLPGNASSLQRFDLDGVEVNPLGTVRVFPKKSIIDGIVRWGEMAAPESPPWPEQDLEINILERETIRATSEALGLGELPTTAAKVAAIRAWFQRDFTYTRYLTIGQARFAKPTAITVFLTKGKRGHCEYFATAATLLLREAGVPARYCVGFAVMENDARRGEFVIRGTHGHAWTRFWDNEQQAWIDFDPTPAGWLGIETGGESRSMRFADAYQRFREDFFLWRNRPANRIGANIVMWLIGGGVVFFVGRRLWRSKLAVSGNNGASTDVTIKRTPLHDLEKLARDILGPRPPGKPFAAWLRDLTAHSIPANELEEALSLHQRIRFDPSPQPDSIESRLSELSIALSRSLRTKP